MYEVRVMKYLVAPLRIVLFLLTLARLITVVPCEVLSHFEGFQLPSNYQKLDPPTGHNGPLAHIPLEVKLIIQIEDVTHVDEVDDEVTLELSIQRMWFEHRVEITKSLLEGVWYAIDPEDSKKFWSPDFYVSGLKDLKIQRGITELKHFMLRDDKAVTQIMRSQIIVKCKFHFSLYPMDVQECKMDFMAPMDPAEELYMVWDHSEKTPAVSFLRERGKQDEMSMNKRFLTDIYICLNNFTTHLQWGEVSTLRFWLIMQRQLKSHILDTYVPTTMFVVMSWGSFLVKPDIVPGRMVLLVTNLLSLVTLFEATRSTSPSAHGVKCIDIWLLSCISFVFFALFEYAIVLFQMHEHCQDKNRIKKLKLFSAISPNLSSTSEEKNTRKPNRKAIIYLNYVYRKMTRCIFCKTSHSTWHIMDQVSIVLFPLSFAIYNIFYWTIYLRRRYSAGNTHACL